MISIKAALLLGVLAAGLLVPATREVAELPMGKDDPELAHVMDYYIQDDLALHRLPAYAQRHALHQ
ncbi:MAG: hypothetical protein PUE51_05105 [Veillonellaceae bacterium]|nr:hypothetical protein [Veillonellaceae bacterium]